MQLFPPNQATELSAAAGACEVAHAMDITNDTLDSSGRAIAHAGDGTGQLRAGVPR